MTNNFDLVKKLLDLPWYNLILISLLVIPLFIGAWTVVLNTFSLAVTPQQKRRFALSFILVYVLGLTIGKIGHERDEAARLKKTVETIKADLRSNGGLMGFKRIRERHPAYNEEMLYRIADLYPEIFGVTPIAHSSDPKLRDTEDPFGLVLRQKD